jgi:hypothetical protein
MRLVSLLNTTVLLSLASAVVLAALFILFFIFSLGSQQTLPGRAQKVTNCLSVSRDFLNIQQNYTAT